MAVGLEGQLASMLAMGGGVFTALTETYTYGGREGRVSRRDNNGMRYYYRPVDIWVRRDEGTLIRYRCLEVLPIGKFCVQSKDFYYSPFKDAAARELDLQFLELLADTPPELRSGLYESVEEAIRSHDNDFENLDTLDS